MRLRWLFAAIMTISAAARANDKITIALNWVPEPEFGGIYAARQTGAFTKRGLDVEIQPGGAGAPTWQLVASGKVDYAIAGADEVLIARTKGADVVAIFATYQTSPQGLMTHASRGFKEIGDIFKNPGTLAIEPGLPYATFLKNKFGFDKLKVVAYDGGIGTFLHDPNFTQQCFITSEPLAAEKAGADPQAFLVAEAGYNPYTAVVITRGEVVKSHPEQVSKMVDALREGWRAYLLDPLPSNQAMAKLNPQMPLETMGQAAEAQKRLIETDETTRHGLGCMNESRWKTLSDQLVDLKVIEQAPPANECFVSRAD